MTTKDPPLNRFDSELRRREWLRIYLPLLVGTLLSLAAVVLSAVLSFKGANVGGDPASVWGDTAALLVIVQVLAIGVIPLVILIALSAVILWLIARLHPVLGQMQAISEQVRDKVAGFGDAAVAAVIKMQKPGARLRAIKQRLRRQDV